MKHLKIFLLIFFTNISISASSQDLKNWFNEDPDLNKFAGVSSDLAHEKLLDSKKSTTVIVAVIDGGTDVNHPDLKDNIWINSKEIPDNGIDDDGNGYVDDIHGWNFIGGPDGDVGRDNMEAVRVYNKFKPLYDGKNKSGLTTVQKSEYEMFINAKKKIDEKLIEGNENLTVYTRMKQILDSIKLEIGLDEFTSEDVMSVKSENDEFNQVKTGVAAAMSNEVSFDDIYKDIDEGYQYFNSSVNYHYNISFNSRHIVNDNYEDYSERFYGNNNVVGPDALHGTHVAGIIGAVRDNDIGINGVAADVKIMVLRAVPDGDERDKDVANAIRYAADNGAKIINMSFGKPFSPGKKHVDDAVRYAASKDVLLIHGAGNAAKNLDKTSNFPNPFYEDTKTREPAWIEVGAISSSGHAANFSNYGVKKVDVFAPGVSIYSTMPDGEYDFQNGTSMAAPVVAGIAAIIRSHYPELTAVQVKQVILDSSIKVPFKTTRPGGKKQVKFKKLSSTGAIVNAYKAVILADLEKKAVPAVTR